MARPTAVTDWVHRAPPARGLERIEAYFAGHGYDMHRHDTYAIGRTLAGVQRFSYRRGQRNSLPGNTMIGIVLLWAAAGLTIYTGWDYFNAGIRYLVEEDERTP